MPSTHTPHFRLSPTRSLAALAVAALLAGTATACNADESQARQTATQLAQGLSQLEVNAVPFTQGIPGTDVTEKFTGWTQSFRGATPQVSVEQISGEDQWQKAKAQLRYAWDLGAGTWTYNTTAALTRTDGKWSVDWQPDLFAPGLKDSSGLLLRRTPGTRGKITGQGAQVLVEERPVVRVGIDKSTLDAQQLDSSARSLAALVDIDPDSYAQQVRASGPKAFVLAIVLRDDKSRTVTDAQIEKIPGAAGLPDTLPLAPTREFARSTLGTVGEATAELIEKSDGRLKAGDQTGLSGLQYAYDARLAGAPGVQVSRVDAPAKGRSKKNTEVLFSNDPQSGSDLATTLDQRVQNLADEALKEKTDMVSSLVAIRPSDGAVLAVANGPGNNGSNTALEGQYPPGSTFKVVTTLAMLRKGVTADTIVQCPDKLDVDGRVFKNNPTYSKSVVGDVPLRTAFAHSCNTAFVNQAQKISQAELASAAAALGFGAGASGTLGLANSMGQVPQEASAVEHDASMIGQGKVEATPLAMATAMASIVKGAPVQPRLVAPDQDQTASADSPPSQPLTAQEAAQLRELMAGVVNENQGGPLKNLPGGQVIAKTGTAEYGNDDPPKTHPWLIAAQPDRDIAVAMFLEDGTYSTISVAPILRKFFLGY